MKYIYLFCCAAMYLAVSSCSPKVGGTQLNGWISPNTTVVSYNEMTMDLDDTPIEYVVDIKTAGGRAKLNGLSLDEAKELVLVEAIMYAKCATIFQPQYTHVVKNGKVLGIKIYGFPARYKKKS